MYLAQSPEGNTLAVLPRLSSVSHTRSGNAAYFLFRAIFKGWSCGVGEAVHHNFALRSLKRGSRGRVEL